MNVATFLLQRVLCTFAEKVQRKCDICYFFRQKSRENNVLYIQMKKENNTIFDRYPFLVFLFPALGGYFAWHFSGMLELGAVLFILGTLSNGFVLYKRRRKPHNT